MKILHTVEFYWPSVGGSQEVVRQLSERLAKLGHEVTVATSKLKERKSLHHNGVTIVEFDISGNAVHGYRGAVKPYQEFITNTGFDLMMNYAAQQWATDLVLEIIDQITAAKVLVPCGFSALHLDEYRDYFEKLPNKMKRYDASIYLGNDFQDIVFAREHGLANLHVIPNGAGADEFEPDSTIDIRGKYNIQRSEFLILSVGSHTGLKGHADAIKIFKKSGIQNATLLIIGNPYAGGCTESCRRRLMAARFDLVMLAKNQRLIISDINRAETVAAYKTADLFLFPSNVEASPIVLFESMAAKIPFLVTDVGNAAEIIEWSNAGQMLPTRKDNNGLSRAIIKKSAEMLKEIYKNGELRTKLAESGYKAWEKRFSWEKITLDYDSLYRNLLNR